MFTSHYHQKQNTIIFCIWACDDFFFNTKAPILDQLRQDVAIKVAKFSKSCLKISYSCLYLKVTFFKKVTQYLGNFCRTICHQELSKIAQSDHTDLLLPLHGNPRIGVPVWNATRTPRRLVSVNFDVETRVGDDVEGVDGADVRVPHVAEHERHERPTNWTTGQG